MEINYVKYPQFSIVLKLLKTIEQKKPSRFTLDHVFITAKGLYATNAHCALFLPADNLPPDMPVGLFKILYKGRTIHLLPHREDATFPNHIDQFFPPSSIRNNEYVPMNIPTMRDSNSLSKAFYNLSMAGCPIVPIDYYQMMEGFDDITFYWKPMLDEQGKAVPSSAVICVNHVFQMAVMPIDND